MKKPIGLVVVLGVAMIAAPAFADDTVKNEAKIEKKADKKGAHTKMEKKSTHDPDGMNNSTTDTEKLDAKSHKTATGGTETEIEHEKKHDAPGMKNDAKVKEKEKVVRDADGKVIEDKTTKE